MFSQDISRYVLEIALKIYVLNVRTFVCNTVTSELHPSLNSPDVITHTIVCRCKATLKEWSLSVHPLSYQYGDGLHSLIEALDPDRNNNGITFTFRLHREVENHCLS